MEVGCLERNQMGESTYGTIGVLECLESGQHGIPSASALQDALGLLDDNVPELLVLVAEDEGEAGGLRVVRRGSKGEDLLEDLLNAAVGDGGGSLEAVDGASELGSGQELVGRDGRGSHCVGWMCDVVVRIKDVQESLLYSRLLVYKGELQMGRRTRLGLRKRQAVLYADEGITTTKVQAHVTKHGACHVHRYSSQGGD